MAKLPGPPKLPLLGNALMLVGKSPPEILKVFEKIHAEYPRFAALQLGLTPEILITDPKDAEVILGSQKLIDKSDEYDFIAEWLATGLLISSGKKWFQRRKVITPAFHFKILDQFVEIFDKHSVTFVKNLGKYKGQNLDVFQPITLCALDIICGKTFSPTQH
jgi:cytochrome P450 family 4